MKQLSVPNLCFSSLVTGTYDSTEHDYIHIRGGKLVALGNLAHREMRVAVHSSSKSYIR
jgi:hypothetical protein